VVDYDDYILSEDWENLRQKRLLKDKYRCTRCGFRHELRIHHLIYDRLGHEDLDDLTTLCVRCHNDIHQELKRVYVTVEQAAQSHVVTEAEYEKKKKQFSKKDYRLKFSRR